MLTMMSPRAGHRIARGTAAALLVLAVAAPGAVAGPGAVAASARQPTSGDEGGSGAPSELRSLQNLPSSILVTLRRGVEPGTVDAAAAARGLVRVAWNPTLRTAQYVAVAGATGSPGTLGVAAATNRARRFDAGERTRLGGLAKALARTAGVAAAAPPVRLEVAAGPTPVTAPNDTYWSRQWAMDAIGVRSGWALTRGRPEIVVAVVDTGVDLDHPDLAGRLVTGTDIGSGDSDPTDENGHGTHVAGIVAAVSGNARGVSGVAPGVLVMPVKVMDDDGSIWDWAVAEGIAWAVARGARVVNMSLGGDNASSAIDVAIDAARAQGVVVVAATGNDGGAVSEPAAYPPALAVAAVEDRPAEVDPAGCSAARFGPGDFRAAAYSNSGPEVDLAAPGSCVISTYPTPSGVSYAYLSGTSMAAPMVAASAALVLSRNPSLTADEVEAALTGTAADLGAPGPDPLTGAGLLQVGAALASVPAPASDGVSPVVRWSGISDGTLVRGSRVIRATTTDASPILATRIYRDGHALYVRRSDTVSTTWNSTGSPDGLHRWSAYGTDAGLRSSSATVHVLVANRRAASSLGSSVKMTSVVRSTSRWLTLRTRSAFVARVSGPGDGHVVLSLVGASGRLILRVRGTGSAAIALSSLAAGRYRVFASTNVARPGLSLGLTAAWLR